MDMSPLLVEGSFNCATPAVTWDLGFSDFIRRTFPFSRLLRHTWWCGVSILTRILMGVQYRTQSSANSWVVDSTASGHGLFSSSPQRPPWLDWLIDWLIVYGFTSRSRIFHLYGDVTIAGEGLQNLGLCSALRAPEQRGVFIVPYLLWHGTSVFPVSFRSTAPFSRLLQHTRGCGGSILTRILTGSLVGARLDIFSVAGDDVLPVLKTDYGVISVSYKIILRSSIHRY
jgi:hypothetical protein